MPTHADAHGNSYYIIEELCLLSVSSFQMISGFHSSCSLNVCEFVHDCEYSGH